MCFSVRVFFIKLIYSPMTSKFVDPFVDCAATGIIMTLKHSLNHSWAALIIDFDKSMSRL